MVNFLSIEDIIQFIVDTIENNKNLFQEIYSVKGVKSGRVIIPCFVKPALQAPYTYCQLLVIGAVSMKNRDIMC